MFRTLFDVEHTGAYKLPQQYTVNRDGAIVFTFSLLARMMIITGVRKIEF